MTENKKKDKEKCNKNFEHVGTKGKISSCLGSSTYYPANKLSNFFTTIFLHMMTSLQSAEKLILPFSFENSIRFVNKESLC